jgi:CubicO group peptidase (beta-lactamase class C family)
MALVVSMATADLASAQSLSFSLFERYLESLREEAGIPGISATVVQNGRVVWERGFGRQDVENNVWASPTTPYLIGDVSQALGAAYLLRKCMDQSYAEVGDRVVRWVPQYSDAATTIRQLLSHTNAGGQFSYDLRRFSDLTPVIEECAHGFYGPGLAQEIFDRFGMTDSVPDRGLATPSSTDRSRFDTKRLERYGAIVDRLAKPYRLDARKRATRSDLPTAGLTAATGVVSTVRDLARFDAALSDGLILERSTLTASWTRANSSGTTLPTGLGWFVQSYNGETIVWQFGYVRDAYSSLVLKVPGRGLTLILMANSDGLSAPFTLEKGDVTTSLFATTFLRLLVQ